MVREPLPPAVPAPIPLIHNPAARSEKSARLHQLLERLEPAPRILATDGPGFAVDEPRDTMGQGLSLPPFLEPRRAAIEAGLKPLD